MSAVANGLPHPKRFYETVEVCEVDRDGRFCLCLDGRVVRTPQKFELAVDRRALAECIAEEWRVQGEQINPDTMPLTKLINTAIDGVRGQEREVIDHIVEYAGSDLLCYRASHPPELVQHQQAAWDPVLAWVDEALGARFNLAEGVMPVAQPASSLASFRAAFSAYDAIPLSALHVMTTLTGSAILALAHARDRLTLNQVWRAAHVDEDYQISQWGEDGEATARRERRFEDIKAASRVLKLSLR